MSLRRKPEGAAAILEERRIDDLINQGGSVAPVERPERTDVKHSLVQLRLAPALIRRIDKVRQLRTVPPPRHTWLLEAVIEKLAHEEKSR